MRTLSDFVDAVDKETSWRRRELTTVSFNIQVARDSKVQVSLRSGLAMLYAHWEGWIKALSRQYLEYVNEQHPSFSDLSDALLGNALRVRLDSVAQAKSARTHEEFAHFVSSGGLQGRARVSPDLVRTNANLTSEVLADVLTRLGLPLAPYELRAALIDERLVRQRNVIAHGEYLDIDTIGYTDLHQTVLEMLNWFTTDLLNAAAAKAYLRNSP